MEDTSITASAARLIDTFHKLVRARTVSVTYLSIWLFGTPSLANHAIAIPEATIIRVQLAPKVRSHLSCLIYNNPASSSTQLTPPALPHRSSLHSKLPTFGHKSFMMKGLFALSLLPLLASASPVLIDTIHEEAAPVLSSTQATEIPDSYIIVFKKDVTHASAAVHHDWVQDQHLQTEKSKRDLEKRSQSQFPITAFSGLRHTYNIAGGLMGYAGHFDESVIERVRRHPDVSRHRHGSSIQHVLGGAS